MHARFRSWGLLLVAAGTGACAASKPTHPAPTVRTYYIAADPVLWDYVPGGMNGIAGAAYVDTAFVQKGQSGPVSTSYRKVLYREYTDSSFATLKPRAPEWEHLGFLGPMIRGVVGDTIKVVFRNNGARPFSVHPHGVFYNKDSEGAPYDDGSSGNDKNDDGVPPGATHTYVWPVPERAGPASSEGSSVMWMYHSHTDEVRDVNTGLLGVMLVTSREHARMDGSPDDVERELVMSFDQVHEEDSWLADSNIAGRLLQAGPRANPAERQNFYPWFVKFTINGFLHGSMPLESVTLRKGDRVRWYVMASTNDFDAHAPHWHGNTVMIHHSRMDVTSLTPMEMVTADMTPDNPGTWLFHCHISFHNTAGMAMRYRVGGNQEVARAQP